MLAQGGRIWAEGGGRVPKWLFGKSAGELAWVLLCVWAVSPSDVGSGFVRFCSNVSCLKKKNNQILRVHMQLKYSFSCLDVAFN